MSAKQQAKEIAHSAKNLAYVAKETTLVDRLARLGYTARGLIYGMIGLLAIQVALTGRGRLEGRTGVLEEIARHPLGTIILAAMAAGLMGLVLWSIIQAVANPYPFDRGKGWKGALGRIGSLVTGVSYGVLLVATVRLLLGVRQANEEQTAQETARGILHQPWGPWLIGLVGIILVVISIVNILHALNGHFTRPFKRYELTDHQLKVATSMGRFGTLSMGIVMGVIGGLSLLAAFRLDPNQVRGMQGALAFLASQPYGPWLLLIVASGLIANAVYSVLGAFWFHIKEQ